MNTWPFTVNDRLAAVALRALTQRWRRLVLAPLVGLATVALAADEVRVRTSLDALSSPAGAFAFRLPAIKAPPGGDRSFTALIASWNAEVLWEPATASPDAITKFGDEARAVFGPIPVGDCNASGSKRLILEVDGNSVDLKPNPLKQGAPLEFEHRDTQGNHVKWTTSLSKCDKPSLAAAAYCSMNSRLNRVTASHVSWTFLCRKSSKNLELDTVDYWTALDPRFSLYGAIGFNELTGEIAFIDGRKDRATFDWSKPFVPPGGQSYADIAGRAEARELYDGTFQVDCFACHDNKKPYVIDPHAKQARVGYFDGETDKRAIAFGLGKYLPQHTARTDAPFRVIGSSYTAGRVAEMKRAKVVTFPGHACTSCHSLTTLETGRRLTADAAGKMPAIDRPTPGEMDALFEEKLFLAMVQNHRTDWALSSGAGKIHPWMLPGNGGDLSVPSPDISDAEWSRLSQCVWDEGGRECGYRPLYTACPAPGKGGDGFGAEDFIAQVIEHPRERAVPVLRLKWLYRNGYGEVPSRDDVRFNIAVKEIELPSGSPPGDEFPTDADARGDQRLPADGKVGQSGSVTVIKNASFSGHERWSDPEPTTGMRDYVIDVPATCGRRYLFRVLPKRFCFDYNGVVYGPGDLVYADIACGSSARGPRSSRLSR